MISGIIKIEVSVISRSRRLRLITLTETLIIPDITKTESNSCFIIHCFEENNGKRIIALPHKKISTLGPIPFCRVAPGYFSLLVFVEQFLLFKYFTNLNLQVISQFLAESMKRIEKPFLIRCP